MFLSCGDSLFDMFIGSGDAQNAEHADALGTVSIDGIVGGSPLNVALGLSRFGHKSRFFTKISEDVFGRRLQAFMHSNNIDTSLSLPTTANTSLAMVERQSDGSAKYVFYIDNTADVSLTVDELPNDLPEDLRVIHFGSYSTAVNPCATSLAKLASSACNNKFISYDPNLRLSIEPDKSVWQETFKAFAKSANVIKASDEDIEGLFGANAEDKFVAESLDAGASLVYITRGGEGGSAFSASGDSAHMPGAKVNVVDTVGAGDTFQASILHWIASENHIDASGSLSGEVDLKASLNFAIKAAGITCTRRGADLPTLSDVTAV